MGYCAGVHHHHELFGRPLGKGLFFSTFKAAASRYLATSGPSCPLFQHFYDQICWEWGEVGLEFGTAEHMEYAQSTY